MLIDRRFRKSIAVALAIAGLAAAAELAAQPAGARAVTNRVCPTIHERGYPDAVPPILAPPACSAQEMIRRQEARESQELWYHLPATARYGNAEVNA